MQTLADHAFERFDLMGLLMVHRVGVMRPGEPIVCVSAAALHRRDAIDAVDFCMDHLKSAAWFWKRELRDGAWHWIEPREADHSDLARWQA
jgi:molybdopterin synthase catalytic subunit